MSSAAKTPGNAAKAITPWKGGRPHPRSEDEPNDYPDLRTTLAPVPGADVFVSNRGSFASLRRPGYFLPTLRVESASGKSRPVLHPKIPHHDRPLTAQVETKICGIGSLTRAPEMRAIFPT